MLAFVGPPLGGPTLSVTQLHTVCVGHASGSNDFRRRNLGSGEKWWSDFGRLDLPSCQILAIGWMQLEKKNTHAELKLKISRVFGSSRSLMQPDT